MNAFYVAAAALFGAGISSSAFAAPSLFADRSAFDVSTGPLTLIDFEDVPVEAFTYSNNLVDPCVLSLPSVIFTCTVGIPGYRQPPLLGISNGRLHSYQIPSAPDHFYMEFTGDSFGLDVITGSAPDVIPGSLPSPFNLEVVGDSQGRFHFDTTLSEQDSFVGVSGLPADHWRVSFYSEEYVQFPGGGPGIVNFLIDNVAVPSPTPEPDSIALFGIGVLSLCVFQRRRKTPLLTATGVAGQQA